MAEKKRNRGAKGSVFERKVCRMLTEWVDPKRVGGKPEMFWRSATSGAKATQDHKAGHQSKMGGDIIAVEPEGQFLVDLFSVECKDRKGYGALELIMEGKGQLAEWWEQCVGDAERSLRMPFLVFKKLHSSIYLLHRVDDFDVHDHCTDIRWDDEFAREVRMVLFEVWLYTVPASQMREIHRIVYGK